MKVTNEEGVEGEQLSGRPLTESQKQVRAVVFWLGIVLALLVFYVFGFPVVLYVADSQGLPLDEIDGFPEWFLNLLVLPLEWLYDNSLLYERWIDWLEEVV